MKKFLLSIYLFCCTSMFALAQEVEQAVEDTGPQVMKFSTTSKWVVLTIWTIIIIILVLRTFRNKPTV